MRIINVWNNLSWDEMNFPSLDALRSRQNDCLEDVFRLNTNCRSHGRVICDMQQVELSNVKLIFLSGPKIYESMLINLYMLTSYTTDTSF